MPATHFFHEILRQRMTSASLEFDLKSVKVEDAWRHDGSLILRVVAGFDIENIGRIAAYKWALVRQSIPQVPDDRVDDYFFGSIPGSGARLTSVRVADTI